MIGEGLHFEQHEIGAVFRTLGRTVSETDIVSFVNLCGFTEPLFTDMEYVARESLFKRRAAPSSDLPNLPAGARRSARGPVGFGAWAPECSIWPGWRRIGLTATSDMPKRRVWPMLQITAPAQAGTGVVMLVPKAISIESRIAFAADALALLSNGLPSWRIGGHRAKLTWSRWWRTNL